MWENLSQLLQNINIFGSSVSSSTQETSLTELIAPRNMDLKPEIENILDFRVVNRSEQYLVNWKWDSNDQRTTWEVEKVLDSMCKELLVKFWVKSVLSRNDSDNNETLANKLWEWAVPSSSVSSSAQLQDSKECQRSPVLYPKKRSRQCYAECDDDSFACEVEKKHPKLSDENDEIILGGDILSKKETDISIHSDKFNSVLNIEEITDPLDIPPYEIGEIINCKSFENENCYLVTWIYISCETAKTLGLDDIALQQHFNLSTIQEPSEIENKFQLQRKRCCDTSLLEPAVLKPVPRKILQADDSGESDISDASTHPPSESEHAGKDSDDNDNDSTGTAELLLSPAQTDEELDVETHNVTKEIGCQTAVELDPFACQYCQSRLGERDRLSSLRKKRVKTESESDAKSETGSETKSQKNSKKSIKAENTEEGDEDDDDLVSIEYEVEQILDYRIIEETNADEYRIRWKGFTAAYDTWEPESNLSCCEKMLVTFFVERMGERRSVEVELQKLVGNGGGVSGKKLPKIPALPPLPESVMEKLNSITPITDEEIEVAYQISKTAKRTSRWPKKKLRMMILHLIGIGGAVETRDLPELRHQVLMAESERRKDLIWKDLKKWEKQLNDIAQGRPEIVVENNYDLSGPPKDFQYINDNILGEGVNFPDDPLEGCDCEDSCVKDKSQCCPGKHGKVLAYTSFKRLRVLPGYPIYECNKRCKCGPDCANRVVQDGTVSLLGTKLCVFRTSDKRGWGVKTLKKIKKGSFVCLYAGEIITTEEAENRGRIYENQLGACYLFDLDYYAGNEESCPYTIDATNMGNVAHFINHSCEPNLCVFNVWADCVDQNLPKLAFFALRDISKDEELLYDYGSHDDTNEMPSSSSQPVPSLPPVPDAPKTPPRSNSGEALEDESDVLNTSMISMSSSPAKNRMKPANVSAVRRPCLCGAKNCRKVLF